MNIFSAAIKAVKSAFGQKKREHISPDVFEARSGRIDFNPSAMSSHLIKIWRSAKPIFGPVSIPDRENHHVSRQTCRHYLRAIAFQGISRQQPLWSRRDRRRLARISAAVEYKSMMTNKTNMVDNELQLIRERSAELVGAA